MDDVDEETSQWGWLRGVLGVALAACVVAVLWRASSAEPYWQAEPAWDVLAAVDRDDLTAVREALDRGTPVDVREYRLTPLLRAAGLGRVRIVELLLSRGADLRQADAFGTALAYAAATRGRAETVRLLLRHGADPDLGRPDGQTPLMLAAAAEEVDSMAALIAAGATIDARDGRGESALDVARSTGRPDVERLLVAAGARRACDTSGRGGSDEPGSGR
jgi:ankyrin repeat protein